MTCKRCQGRMARDHYLDIEQSGGEWWVEGWRCINCGHVFDPVVERNRRQHAAAMASVAVSAQDANDRTSTSKSKQDLLLDTAA